MTTWSPAEYSPRVHDRSDDRTAIVLTGIGLLLSFAMAWLSDGVYHDDDLTHLQFARWALGHPQFLLNDWGRPGFTVLYFLPAQLGWTVARLFSGVLTAATGWLAYRIGQHLKVPAAPLIPALLWLQPLTFSLSYTTLTEPVLAFYLTLAIWLRVRGHHRSSAAVLSLCLVTRYEAVVFLPIWIWASWGRKRAAQSAWLLLWAPAAHNLLSYLFLGEWPIAMFFKPKPTDYYASGGWLTLAARWLEAAGPGLIILAVAGSAALWRKKRDGKLCIIVAAAYFLAHTLIYRFGLFASGGYARFLVPLGPLVALAAAAALSEFSSATKLRHMSNKTKRGIRRCAMLGMLACIVLWIAAERESPAWLGWGMRWPVVALFVLMWASCHVRKRSVRMMAIAACPIYLIGAAAGQTLRQCRPHVLQEDQLMIREAADWIEASQLQSRRIVTANIWIDEFLGLRRSPFRLRIRDAWAAMQPGDLLVWDARYCPQPPNRLPLGQVRRDDDMIELWHGGKHTHDGIYCYVFEKRRRAATQAKGG